MAEGNHKDNGGYRYSYSGADCKVFAYRGAKDPIFLESVQTISFSIHEPRGRARALGHKAVKGFSRSVREIAGTMIFTVIEDHPLAKLMTVESGGNYASGWSVDGVSRGVGTFLGNQNFNGSVSLNRIATTMPAFNLMLTYATEVVAEPSPIFSHKDAEGNTAIAPDLTYKGEYHDVASKGNVAAGRDIETAGSDWEAAAAEQLGILNNGVTPYRTKMDSLETSFENSYSATVEQKNKFEVNVAGLVLEGIEIITEGIVTSVNDMITEIQVQFIAKNYKEFSLSQYDSFTDGGFDMDLAREYLKEVYKEHNDWARYESELEDYELELNLDAGRGVYRGLKGLLDYKSETTFLNKVDYNSQTGIFTLNSITNLNPVLMLEEDPSTEGE